MFKKIIDFYKETKRESEILERERENREELERKYIEGLAIDGFKKSLKESGFTNKQIEKAVKIKFNHKGRMKNDKAFNF